MVFMGSRGPIGKSKKERELTGNAGKHNLSIVSPAFRAVSKTEIPEPPIHISQSAVSTWVACIQIFSELDILQQSDLSALARYAQYLADWSHVNQLIAESGYIVEKSISGGGTNLAKNPLVSVRQELERDLQRLGKSFGLDPAARSRLEFRANEVEDDYELFLQEHS